MRFYLLILFDILQSNDEFTIIDFDFIPTIHHPKFERFMQGRFMFIKKESKNGKCYSTWKHRSFISWLLNCRKREIEIEEPEGISKKLVRLK